MALLHNTIPITVISCARAAPRPWAHRPTLIGALELARDRCQASGDETLGFNGNALWRVLDR